MARPHSKTQPARKTQPRPSGTRTEGPKQHGDFRRPAPTDHRF